MAKNKRKIFLSVEIVAKLISVLKAQLNSDNLNVTNKQLVNHLIAQLQAKLDATPRKGIQISNELVDTILMTSAKLLSNGRVVQALIDFFFGDKR